MEINENCRIPLSELKFQFARSGGKGGQNVNKVETKVELSFDVFGSQSLSDSQRRRLLETLGSRLDHSGVMRIVVQESRSQWKNREIAVHKFVEVMKKALKPRKKRVATKITRTANEKRLERKKRRGAIKKIRSGDEW
ncbi:MAG TPA: alternative ribosome rescue aminoacyl-tRNA hydrolase ArfB [Bacteroidota bacterium]|nr:alternative ribosome rescue aminoacyl-tRNA hydrolase ArfB [Bacteroidota bacterium]